MYTLIVPIRMNIRPKGGNGFPYIHMFVNGEEKGAQTPEVEYSFPVTIPTAYVCNVHYGAI